MLLGKQTDQNLTLDFVLGEREDLDIASDKNNIWAAVEDFLEEKMCLCLSCWICCVFRNYKLKYFSWLESPKIWRQKNIMNQDLKSFCTK